MKRSPYMSIIENLGSNPKIYDLPSKYEASIAATCVKALAAKRKIMNVRVFRKANTIIVWQGPEHVIKFDPPKRYVGRPLGSFKVDRQQVERALGCEARA
jgi:hypothetical protein